jgi:hypothetical protein
MTDPTIHGVPVPPPMTLEQIAAGAAALGADARAAGLTPPFTLSCHDYGPPAVTLYLYAGQHDTPATWRALREWAERYGTEVTTHPGVSPGSVHATAVFCRDGITYDVSAVIRPTTEDDQPEQDRAA